MIGSTYGGAVVVGRERRARLDDEQIAADLYRDGVITEKEYAVWQDMTETRDRQGFELNRKHMLSTRRLQEIAKAVKILVSKRRIWMALIGQPRDPSGHTTASGSHTRHVGDPTAQGHEPISSWNEERMKAFGKLDRWSRKRR